MNLNLSILQEDLPVWNLQGLQADEPWVARCRQPYFCTAVPEHFQEDLLYVIDAKLLPPSPHITGSPSILTIGKPEDSWLTGKYNVMYTQHSGGMIELMNAINARFFFYSELEKQLQNCIDQRLSMQSMAIIVGDVLHRPVYGQGSGFKVLFNYLPPLLNPTPEYLKQMEPFNAPEGTTLSEEGIKELIFDEEYNRAVNTTAPTMFYSPTWEIPCLYLNLFLEGELVARITMDEVPNPINSRDILLIQLLGEYVKKALLRERINPYDRPKALDEILQKLLSHTLIPERRLQSLLEDFGWQMEDSYFCAVMNLKEKHWDIDALNPVALRLSNYLGSNCYTVYNDSIVFLCNMTKVGRSRKDLISEIKPILRDNLITASFSTEFRSFKDLYYFYQQALAAGKLGAKKDPTFWYFRFEDYQNDFLLEQYTKNTIVDTLIPQGLRDLMDHDTKKGTSYVSLLKIYLDQERSIINTVRASYTSRSTFIYQIQRVQEILQMDLDDPEVRLLLMMVFRLLGRG